LILNTFVSYKFVFSYRSNTLIEIYDATTLQLTNYNYFYTYVIILLLQHNNVDVQNYNKVTKSKTHFDMTTFSDYNTQIIHIMFKTPYRFKVYNLNTCM